MISNLPPTLAELQGTIAQVPQAITPYLHLAAALAAAGHASAAARAYHQAGALAQTLRSNLAPGQLASPQILQQGNTLAQAGEWDQAAAAYRQAIAQTPYDPAGWLNLGVAQERLGQREGAIACYQIVLRLDPQRFSAHYNLGNLYRRQEDWAAACPHYAQAVAIAPDQAAAWRNYGEVLFKLQHTEAAAAAYRQVLALRPDWGEVWAELAAVLSDLGQWDEAATVFERAIATSDVARQSWLVYYNYGNLFYKQQDFERAIALYDHGLAVEDNPWLRWNLSHALLRTGQLARGWQEYEARWQTVFAPPHYDHRPRWQGEPLAGQTILLHSEQGFGDSLQFVRYVPLLAAQGARVALAVPQPLKRLFQAIAGVAEVVSEGDPLPDFDTYASLLSLPGILGTTIETIPNHVPYLHLPPDLPRPQLPGSTAEKLKVGLVWASGRLEHPALLASHRSRSLSLAALLPAVAQPGVALYSLQVGPAVAELVDQGRGDHASPLSPGCSLPVDLSHCLGDFADTAAIVDQLDLVITVDTSVAHLAGGLGKPTWVLLPWLACWRWLLERADSPWYPTVRLFRQAQPDDWQAALDHVAAALAEHRRQHTGGRTDEAE